MGVWSWWSRTLLELGFEKTFADKIFVKLIVGIWSLCQKFLVEFYSLIFHIWKFILIFQIYEKVGWLGLWSTNQVDMALQR